MANNYRSTESSPLPVSLAFAVQRATKDFFDNYRHYVARFLLVISLLCYIIYFSFAIWYDIELAKPLIILTCLVVTLMCYVLIRDQWGSYIYNNLLKPVSSPLRHNWLWFRWVLVLVLCLVILLYLILTVFRDARQLQSLLGLVIFLTIPWLTSKHADKIKWQPVLWGLALQFFIGLFVLRWRPGYIAVKFLSDEVNKFLWYSLDGAAKVFGDPIFFFHPFLMLVIPLVIYCGTVIAIFHYCNLTQLVAEKIGWLMEKTLGITCVESLTLAANIFLNVLDTVLLLRPYVKKLTDSEFHTFLVGSHSTIAGFAFALFHFFGVPPHHLLSGAIMSAPAAVAISKLNYPETEESQFKYGNAIKLDRGSDANIVLAAAKGAWASAVSSAAICLQVIAFMSILSFLEAVVAWLGAHVGVILSLEIIFSYLFWPFAFLLGVDWQDIPTVSNIVGMKLVANEMLAFADLGYLVNEGLISARSAAITTYAICGFSSFGTLAIFVGVWSTIDPSKVNLVASQIPRIMMNANISCFLTACVAGILYNDEIDAMDDNKGPNIIGGMWNAIPGYKDLLDLLEN